MTYEVRYLQSVVRVDIPNLPTKNRPQIARVISERLTVDPIAFGKPLQYSLQGLRRLRVGDYRIVYQVDHAARRVWIVRIAHRKDVYA